MGIIEILYDLLGYIENLYGLERKKLLRIVYAFQYITKQSRLNMKNLYDPIGRIENLYGLVGCI